MTFVNVLIIFFAFLSLTLLSIERNDVIALNDPSHLSRRVSSDLPNAALKSMSIYKMMNLLKK